MYKFCLTFAQIVFSHFTANCARYVSDLGRHGVGVVVPDGRR